MKISGIILAAGSSSRMPNQNKLMAKINGKTILESVLDTALNMGIPYVAVVASRKKAGLIMDYLKENDVQEETLQRFHSPAGLDLNAKSAEEIALSILSEIVMFKNSGSGKILGS
jgi:xanthine/CO dehydrogenase XdhC/CoxF family maturation factor